MARKSKVGISKIRIRDHVRGIAEYAAEEIDQFRDHVAAGRDARLRSIEKRAAGLSPEAQEFLADDIAELDTVSRLADQLAIVASYRVVELTTRRLIVHEFGKSAERQASEIGKVATLLQNRKGIDLKKVPHYRAVDELRLLNNAIKHTGRVTKKLAAYGRWKEGDDLTGLDAAYDRLRPKIPLYIFRLAQRMKLRYK